MEQVNGVVLTHSNVSESFRLIRLKKVLSIWDILSNNELLKPSQLHEHKGCLEVFFKSNSTNEDKQIFCSIWELFNEYEVVFNK